jgi:DNA-binding GntR family transcriptional regulator
MNQAKLDPIRGNSLGVMVADSIRSAIYAGRFKPGDAVREMQIARELRVSQTTVREALLQLEHAGLVVREANRGTRITILSEEDVKERITIRVVLETTAALEAARRMTDSDLSELENRKQQLATAIRRNQYYDAAQLDLAFHRVIWRACGNQTLFRMLDELTAPLFAFISVRQSGNLEDLKRRVGSHDPIFQALKSRRATEIRNALSDHLTKAYLRSKSIRAIDDGGSHETIRKLR